MRKVYEFLEKFREYLHEFMSKIMAKNCVNRQTLGWSTYQSDGSDGQGFPVSSKQVTALATTQSSAQVRQQNN